MDRGQAPRTGLSWELHTGVTCPCGSSCKVEGRHAFAVTPPACVTACGLLSGLCGACRRKLLGTNSCWQPVTLWAIFSNSSGAPVTVTVSAAMDLEKICARTQRRRQTNLNPLLVPIRRSVLRQAALQPTTLSSDVEMLFQSGASATGLRHRDDGTGCMLRVDLAHLHDAARQAEDVCLLVIRPPQHHLRSHAEE